MSKDELESDGVDVIHHYGNDIYAKETFIDEGLLLKKHTHPFDHLSILAHGQVKVTVEGVETIKCAPCCILIEANKEHSVEALTEVVWYCIHSTANEN